MDGDGAVVAAGHISSTATFGGVVLTSAGSRDAVLWKVSGEGTTLWAVHGGGTSFDSLSGVAVDGTGAVVAAGTFAGFTFNTGDSPETFGGMAFTSAGDVDAVLWKLSGEGTTLWVVRGGGRGWDILRGVAVDGEGAVVAAGYCQTASGARTFGSEVLINPSDLVWKVNDEGTTLWAVSGGRSTSESLQGVAVDGAGSVVVAGSLYYSPATFGGVVLVTTTAGSRDAVLWKMSAKGTTLWAVRGGGTSDDVLYGVAVDGAGGVVAAGYINSSPATFGGEALTNAGNSDALVWKVSDVARVTNRFILFLHDAATISPSRTYIAGLEPSVGGRSGLHFISSVSLHPSPCRLVHARR